MSALLRQPDIVALHDGEEFTLPLPKTDFMDSQKLAARIRQAITELATHYRSVTLKGVDDDLHQIHSADCNCMRRTKQAILPLITFDGIGL